MARVTCDEKTDVNVKLNPQRSPGLIVFIRFADVTERRSGTFGGSTLLYVLTLKIVANL